MLEAALLTGIPVTDERSARKAVDILLELGVRQVFLSMGAAGVLYGNAGVRSAFPTIRRRSAIPPVPVTALWRHW